MNIIGALAKSNSESIIYFCEYNDNEIHKDKLSELLSKSKYKGRIAKSTIRAVAVESTDEMVADKRIVGLLFYENPTWKSVLLPKYEELNIYLKDFTDDGEML